MRMIYAQELFIRMMVSMLLIRQAMAVLMAVFNQVDMGASAMGVDDAMRCVCECECKWRSVS